MATIITSSHKICDMCGNTAHKFINGKGEKITASMGYIHSQSDRWEKTISINLTASIPYESNDDICTDCVKEAFNLAIKNIDKGVSE